jgi:hypothetical protein
MLGIDKFVEADKLGDNATLKTGRFGMIYGVNVWVSNNLSSVAVTSTGASTTGSSTAYSPGYKVCTMFHRNCFGLAAQIKPRIQSTYSLEDLGTQIVGDALYGVGILRNDHGIQIRTTIE